MSFGMEKIGQIAPREMNGKRLIFTKWKYSVNLLVILVVLEAQPTTCKLSKKSGLSNKIKVSYQKVKLSSRKKLNKMNYIFNHNWKISSFNGMINQLKILDQIDNLILIKSILEEKRAKMKCSWIMFCIQVIWKNWSQMNSKLLIKVLIWVKHYHLTEVKVKKSLFNLAGRPLEIKMHSNSQVELRVQIGK